MRLFLTLGLMLCLAACHAPPGARRGAAPTPRELAQAAQRDMTAELRDVARGFNGEVGIAVMDLQGGWVAHYRGAESFPQQSVAKLWVALAVLDHVDQGRLRLDTPVLVQRSDLSVFYQPIAREVRGAGLETDVHDLLHRALVFSDNAADDRLMALVGGAPAVEQNLARRRLEGLSVGDRQPALQSRIAGVEWRPEWAGDTRAFRRARAQVPDAVRLARIDDYLRRPYDGATPIATVNALARLQRGELLNPDTTALMLDTMRQARTGVRRLGGGLEPGWVLAHKTGTGPDWRDESVGINDVGLMTAPDGRIYAVAVFIARTRAPIPERQAMMQQVTRAIINQWAGRPLSWRPSAPGTPTNAAQAPGV